MYVANPDTVLLVCPDRPSDVSVCALLSIVCPLPSCYPIIASVAPPVSPSLPSFVSLFSLLVSVVLCRSIVLRRVCFMFACSVVHCLPACFSCLSLFYFVIKKTIFLNLSPHLISQSQASLSSHIYTLNPMLLQAKQSELRVPPIVHCY